MQLMSLIFTYSYSTTFTLYESTLYLSLYLKGELRYIRFWISAAMLAAILEKYFFTYFQISDHICDTPVKFDWNIPNSSEVITISFWGSKKTLKWPSCDFFRIWPTRVNVFGIWNHFWDFIWNPKKGEDWQRICVWHTLYNFFKLTFHALKNFVICDCMCEWLITIFVSPMYDLSTHKFCKYRHTHLISQSRGLQNLL